MSSIATLLITVFLGPLGVHKFIQKKTGMGLLYLFTGGLFGVGWLVDIILAFCSIIRSKKSEQLSLSKLSNNKQECFGVAGIEYYMPAIHSLWKINPDWNASLEELSKKGKCGQKIYQHQFIDAAAELVPEPTNSYDSDAVKVLIQERLVGYLYQSDNEHYLRMAKKWGISGIRANKYGGKYKVVSTNGDVETMESNIRVRVIVSYR